MPGREPKWSLSPFYEVRKASYNLGEAFLAQKSSSAELAKSLRSLAESLRQISLACQERREGRTKMLEDIRDVLRASARALGQDDLIAELDRKRTNRQQSLGSSLPIGELRPESE